MLDPLFVLLLEPNSRRNTQCNKWGKVILLKTLLPNFCPKQADEYIGDHMAPLFGLLYCLPNLT